MISLQQSQEFVIATHRAPVNYGKNVGPRPLGVFGNEGASGRSGLHSLVGSALLSWMRAPRFYAPKGHSSLSPAGSGRGKSVVNRILRFDVRFRLGFFFAFRFLAM